MKLRDGLLGRRAVLPQKEVESLAGFDSRNDDLEGPVLQSNGAVRVLLDLSE
jgi:hypothetical protein